MECMVAQTQKKHLIVKKTFLLVEDGNMLDMVTTYSKEDAILIFKRDRGWIFSDRCQVIPEEDLKWVNLNG